ncbi:NrdJb [Pseudoxanthomonas winnipegensis]|uniref:ribonucleoside-diphosphate reductase n=1 Tax=Pseudoxanthomonas winnipegensis TaxID=2480810 RepID=A0A4Q8M1I4_9GAMM|nr:NrdJb [Pseudoxanthomonas winnipegensis]TAA40119.1 NrdJb [Pseudoxanthomonas winnipegensis]
MAVKIDKKIKGYSVLTPEDKARQAAAPVPAESVSRATAEAELPVAEVIQMHERIERPDVLVGSTYKIKSPMVEHAMYVTINDIVLNAGTEHEHRRPFEIFINSKSMEHFQWIVALTRIMSAVFRKGGDVTFLVDEMKAVFDPRGGYFKAGGVYMPSLVAELGAIVEEHMKSIGLIHDPEMSEHQKAILAEKRKQYEDRSKKNTDVTPSAKRSEAPAPSLSRSEGEGRGGVAPASASALIPNSTADHVEDIEVTGDGASFPPSASMCHKCNTKAMVIMDGCQTCLNCGYSKCG